MMKLLVVLQQLSTFVLLAVQTTQAFSVPSPPSTAAADEAVAIFAQKFPFDREPPPPTRSTGMPDNDIDGTPLRKQKYSGKRLSDLSEEQVRDNFDQLAAVYGEDQALDMCKIMPVALTFEPSNFAPTLVEFSKIFGNDESKEMVGRNPGLLAVRPAAAAKSNDQTMTFSYLVAYTRPISKVALVILPLLLFLPILEAVLGVSLRANLWSSLTGVDADVFKGFFG